MRNVKTRTTLSGDRFDEKNFDLKNVLGGAGEEQLDMMQIHRAAKVLSIKENDYVMAEHAAGASNLRIMLRHVLPNCFPPFIVMITMQMGAAIMAEAGLSFIGIGIQPPTASWGSMVNDGYKYLLKVPVLSVAPGAAILLIVFAFNMVGDGLRDALDPRLRGTI